MRSDQITCDSVAALLPAVIDGNERADRRVRRHVESCLRCQAELVQYRKLLKALRHLRTEVLEPNPGVLSGILAGLEEAGERGAIRSLLSGRRTAVVTMKTKDELAALYDRPDPTSAIAARLQVGVVAQVKKCANGWCRVIGNGFDGWIEQQRLWGVYADEKVE